MDRDFLDEMFEERSHRNPRFPDLVAEAERRRDLAHRLADERRARGISQTVVAARMRTAASVISKLEAGGDVKLSTLQRYCMAIGKDLSFAVSSKTRSKGKSRTTRKSA